MRKKKNEIVTLGGVRYKLTSLKGFSKVCNKCDLKEYCLESIEGNHLNSLCNSSFRMNQYLKKEQK